jgi:hypothetical protein
MSSPVELLFVLGESDRAPRAERRDPLVAEALACR